MPLTPPSALPFGQALGKEAQLFVLENEHVRTRITDYAGAIVSVEVRDRAGAWGHVLLGFDDAGAYEQAKGSFGALLGRNANRIAGGRIVVDGQPHMLSKNDGDNTLHGGANGFSKQFWTVAGGDAQRLELRLTSPDGDQGFPGEVTVKATYRLVEAELHLAFDAATTKATPISLSAHPYFNLDGPDAFDCLDHHVQIFAPGYLPTDKAQIPTGEVRAVRGTPFDFIEPRPIRSRIREPDPQLEFAKGYDHFFVLTGAPPGETRLAARVTCARSGRVLELLTSQRGTQFYSGNHLDGSAYGRGGAYRQSAGFAFEPQGFPNAPNEPRFPSTILRPGEAYHEEIVYRFLTVSEGDRR